MLREHHCEHRFFSFPNKDQFLDILSTSLLTIEQSCLLLNYAYD